MQILVRSKTIATMRTRTGRKNCTQEMKYAIFNTVRTGMAHINVVIHFSISTTESKMLKQAKDKENCIMKKRGPKFKLSEAAIRILQRILLKNNKKQLFVTVNEFRVNYGYKLYIKTVRKYVYKSGLRNYAAVSKPYLMPRHVIGRKRWGNMNLKSDICQ